MKSLSALLRSVIQFLFLFHLPLLCVGDSRQPRIFYASSQPGEQLLISYTALYTDKVILKCPEETNITQPSWGRRVHGHKFGISQCYDRSFNCTVVGGVISENGVQLLGNDDSGLYFCRDEGSHVAEYYLNLTVLAPPQIVGDISQCPSYHFCEQSHNPVDPNSDNSFSISVEYFGGNATTVEWRLHGEPITCERKECTRTDVSDGLYHKSTLKVRVFNSGSHSEFAGNYTTNISSEYGWNVSSTQIQPQCYLYPPGSTRYDTRTYKGGDTNVSIACGVEYGNELLYLALCYAADGGNITEVNVTENCLLCDLKQHDGYCNISNKRSLLSRPEWKVNLTVQKAQVQNCISKHTIELEIPKISLEDNNGIVYCTWSQLPMATHMHVYDQFTLKVLKPSPTWIKVNWKYLVTGGGLFVSLVLMVVVLLVVALVHSWRKARRAEANRKRRLEKRKPRKSISPPLPVQTERTASDVSDGEVVFVPQRVSSASRSSNSPQSSAQIVVDDEIHDRSPLLPKAGHGPSTLPHYGAVSQPACQEPGDYTDAPLICITADEGDWTLPGVNGASNSNV